MWKTISVEFERYKSCKNNSYIFYMPEGIGYDGYHFFHSGKLVDFYDKEIFLSVTNEWIFTLYKTEKTEDGKFVNVDTKYLKLEEFEELMNSIPTVHIPPELEPLEDVEALEELIDE